MSVDRPLGLHDEQHVADGIEYGDVEVADRLAGVAGDWQAFRDLGSWDAVEAVCPASCPVAEGVAQVASARRVSGGCPEQGALEADGRHEGGRYGDERFIRDEGSGNGAAARLVAAEPDERVGGFAADVLGESLL